MCGESTISRLAPASNRGSPPHVWGKLWLQGYFIPAERITPTCVGKALPWILPNVRTKDHPHMCGESLKVFAGETITAGSPPHVWGKLAVYCSSYAQVRITPTCVGKALRPYDVPEVPWDHPHMCGESCIGVQYGFGWIGSPPHVWGKP